MYARRLRKRSYRRAPRRSRPTRYKRRYGRRRVGRGRRTGYPPRRLRISPREKKTDTVIGSVKGTGQSGAFNVQQGLTASIYCPTWRDVQAKVVRQGLGTEHVRTSDELYYTGFKDRMSIQCTAPFVWRRIAIWTYERYTEGIPELLQDQGNGTQVYTRSINPIQTNRPGSGGR